MTNLLLLIQSELIVPLDTEFSSVLIYKLASVFFILGMIFVLERAAAVGNKR